MHWIETSICQPHPQLGREGSVCPYVSTSREKGLFWLTAYVGARPGLEEVCAVASIYREWFLALEPQAGPDAQYKTISILFPDMQERDAPAAAGAGACGNPVPALSAAPRAPAPALIDQAQLLLKPAFVQQGLMIGQFHAESNEPGVWNPAFHPLRSPIPLLVMRPMVPHDILFLAMEEGFVRAYLERFARRVPRRLQSTVQAAAHKYGLVYPPDDEAGADNPSTCLSDQSKCPVSVAQPAQREQA
jgi:hypothetical protein